MTQNHQMGNIENHVRVNDILLSKMEKAALNWLVMRLPAWVTPDMLTFFGFLSAILIGVSYALTNLDKNFLWLANLGFLLNWFGDSLDGTLARHRKIERPIYGFYIDHVVDIISEVFIFLGLALSPYVDIRLGLIALIAYLCMTNLVFLITAVEGVFKISYGKLGPTEARIIAVAANIFIYYLGNPIIHLPFGNWSLYNLVVIGVVVLLGIFFLVTALGHSFSLSKYDQAKPKYKKHTG
jgi:phosphatidylglycerophosphate synthase